jgi:hypothetical protein
VPFVLIALGIYILYESKTYQLLPFVKLWFFRYFNISTGKLFNKNLQARIFRIES